MVVDVEIDEDQVAMEAPEVIEDEKNPQAERCEDIEHDLAKVADGQAPNETRGDTELCIRLPESTAAVNAVIACSNQASNRSKRSVNSATERSEKASRAASSLRLRCSRCR